MRVVIYARVSTDAQDTANQIVTLRGWAAQRGWEIVEVYQETESAWRAGHQEALARLTAECRIRRHPDAVIVWALDRLSRQGALAILQLVHTLKQYGVRVISYQESWTEAPGELAEVLYAIAGWVARMESQRRSERTKAGLDRARRTGGGRRGPDRPSSARGQRKQAREKRPPAIRRETVSVGEGQ